MHIRPIRDDDDHAAALAKIEELWGAEHGSPEADVLEVLVTLVDAYEATHHPIDPPDPIEAIRFRMEQAGLGRSSLEHLIGGRGRVSEVLNRKRGLTLPAIRLVHEYLGISAEVLIRSSSTDELPGETVVYPATLSLVDAAELFDADGVARPRKAV